MLLYGEKVEQICDINVRNFYLSEQTFAWTNIFIFSANSMNDFHSWVSVIQTVFCNMIQYFIITNTNHLVISYCLLYHLIFI